MLQFASVLKSKTVLMVLAIVATIGVLSMAAHSISTNAYNSGHFAATEAAEVVYNEKLADVTRDHQDVVNSFTASAQDAVGHLSAYYESKLDNTVVTVDNTALIATKVSGIYEKTTTLENELVTTCVQHGHGLGGDSGGATIVGMFNDTYNIIERPRNYSF